MRAKGVLALVALLLDPASGGSLFFTVLPLGDNVADTTYVLFPGTSALRCAALCLRLGYKLFTFDSTTAECQVAPELTEELTPIAAPATRITYVALTVDGATYRVTDTVGTWDEGKSACEVLGGKMTFLPDSTTGVVLHHLHGQIYLGGWRPPASTDLMTWYDVDGNVLTLTRWTPNQPNNYQGNQFKLRTLNGLVDDGEGTSPCRSLCLVPN